MESDFEYKWIYIVRKSEEMEFIIEVVENSFVVKGISKSKIKL